MIEAEAEYRFKLDGYNADKADRIDFEELPGANAMKVQQIHVALKAQYLHITIQGVIDLD
jgi:hypothetical protein